MKLSRPSSHERIAVHALGVVGVVHRVGLGHALDEPELELVALGEPELLELAHAELDEGVVVHLPHLVAGEAEELEPHAGLAWDPGTIHGLQERKFWMRPTFTFGSWM